MHIRSLRKAVGYVGTDTGSAILGHESYEDADDGFDFSEVERGNRCYSLTRQQTAAGCMPHPGVDQYRGGLVDGRRILI